MNRAGWLLSALLLVGALTLPYVGGYPLAYVLMALTLVATLLLLVHTRRLEMSPAGICLTLAVGLIAVAFTLTGAIALTVNFIFLLAFVPLSNWFARFASPRAAAIVGWLALLGAAVAASYASWEVFALGRGRARGWGSDPIWSAQAALILGFLALIGIPAMRSPWRYLLLLAPALAIYAVTLSGSRGPLLVAPLLLVAVFAVGFRQWWRQMLLGVGGIVLMAALVLSLWPEGQERVARAGEVLVALVTGNVTESSAGVRLAFWRSGLMAFADAPLIGHGWNNRMNAPFQHLAELNLPPDVEAAMHEGHHHLHSDILDMAVSAGLFGLVAYGLILLAPLLAAWRSVRDSQYTARLTGAAVLSLGYFGCGLTYLMFGYEFLTTLYVCLCAIILGFCRDAPPLATPAARLPGGG